MKRIVKFLFPAFIFLFIFSFCVKGKSDELKVGAAEVDITPAGTVYIAGWSPYRISKGVKSPLKVNILAIESKGAKGKTESAMILAFDLVSVRAGLMLPLRKAISEKFPDFDINKILICATHTHCAPVVNDPDTVPKGITKPSDYVRSIIPKIIAGMESAWNSRCKAKFSYGLGNAAVACNRVSVYKNGSGQMYGKTGTPSFRSIESAEDHEVGSMFFWDEKDHPIAFLVNVACPAQENERHDNQYLSSDYWGDVRDLVHKKYGESTVVVGICAAAGDVSPHQTYHTAARNRMIRLRNLSDTEEIARRIFQGIEEVYPYAFTDRQDSIIMKHQHKVLSLPQRIPTKEEYERVIAENKKLGDLKNTTTRGNDRIIERYLALEKNPQPLFKTPVNVLRLGDTVLCTNQFEYYTAYGIQIKARSRAVQTFVAQLTNGCKDFDTSDPEKLNTLQNWGSSGSYLPTKTGVKGGAYGGMLRTNIVGPEGGQVLAEETLKMIEDLWK
ncbi:MAG: hypothetical protein Q4G69_09530 [Planctomycetia bacterium]|nr:hypothetical protein [Planctomycetia bacterium]